MTNLNFVDSEKMAFLIAEFLKKNCPMFSFEQSGKPYGRVGAVWHGCNCQGTGGSCICVWYRTNICPQGKWEMPFLKTAIENDLAKRKEALQKMTNVDKRIFTKA